MKKINVGFVGFGEINSPLDIIIRKCERAKKSLFEKGISIIDGGIVADDEDRIQAAEALERLNTEQIDALVLCVAGWIPSYVVIRIADMFKHLPIVLWGLTGYYENGHLVTTADQAGTSALRKPMKDLGFTFKYFYDTIDGISATNDICTYLKIVNTKKALLTAKIGMMGYRDMNLYGTMFDGISLKEKTGVEIEFIEMLEMKNKSLVVEEEQIRFYLNKVKSEWTFLKEPKDETLITGIKYFLALKDIITKKNYDGISLIDVDGMKKHLNYPPSMIFMLLANEMGLCTIPENDSLGSVTQLIVKGLTGQIGMYLEFYEYMKDRVLMGVPDYVPLETTQGDYKVMPISFGLLDEGILNVSQLKTGTVTLCRLYKTKSSYAMHITTGEAVKAQSWEEAGWTPPAPQLPSLEIILGAKTNAFVQNVMSQHYIIIYGDHVSELVDYCNLCDIEVDITG